MNSFGTLNLECQKHNLNSKLIRLHIFLLLEFAQFCWKSLFLVSSIKHHAWKFSSVVVVISFCVMFLFLVLEQSPLAFVH